MAFLQTTAASISSGGTINGDLTIDGELTVSGTGAFAYTEVVTGDMKITNAYDTIGLEIEQDGDETALKINQDSDRNSIFIESVAQTYHTIYFNSPVLTSGSGIFMSGMDTLTTGSAIKIDAGGTSLASTATGGLVEISYDGAGTNTNNLLYIVNDATNATGTTGLKVHQKSTGSTITATAPSGTNDCVVPIGIALEPDMIYFNPTQTIIEHA